MKTADSHSTYMRRALKLAAKGRYSVSPNPMVGCVIVKAAGIIAEGWHQKAGSAHAEINALNNATASPEGASLYVTLEPCCHHGRTPPCTDVIIKAGIKVVYVACLDPNPLVAGQGVAKLRAAGIVVHVGLSQKAAQALNAWFFHYIQHKRPYVIAKWAMSLDGKTVVNPGDDPGLSCQIAWNKVHRLRQSVDAILVGANTIRHDNPKLTARVKQSKIAKTPLRVVVSSRGKLPLTAQVLNGSLPGTTLVVTSALADKSWIAALITQGVEVLVLPLDQQNEVSLVHLMDALAARHIVSVLLEGGMRMHQSFLASGLVNEIQAAVCPLIIGSFAHKQPIKIIDVKKMGSDFSFHCQVDIK